MELPKGKQTVGCKWVFTLKHNPDGSIQRYKARLAAKGFTQANGIDYFETFSSVAKLNSISAILSLAANFDWPLYQMDVKNAFLHGDLKEVYMDPPPSFIAKGQEDKVCRLKKSLYGLKQSPMAWFDRFVKPVTRFGYKRCHVDHIVFEKRKNLSVVILVEYIDDIAVTGNDGDEINSLQAYLRKWHCISQHKYTMDLLEDTGKLGAKPADTPIE